MLELARTVHPFEEKQIDNQIARVRTSKPVSSDAYRHEQVRCLVGEMGDTVIGITHSV